MSVKSYPQGDGLDDYRVLILLRIMSRAFDVSTLYDLEATVQDMLADELADRVAFIAEHHMAAVKSLLGWREGNAKGNKPIGLFRFILARFGLKLERKQARRGEGSDNRTYTYTLDAGTENALLATHILEIRRKPGWRYRY